MRVKDIPISSISLMAFAVIGASLLVGHSIVWTGSAAFADKMVQLVRDGLLMAFLFFLCSLVGLHVLW
jgi:NADH:ubiquinone oxidoreductase subunit 4 (subunit M)